MTTSCSCWEVQNYIVALRLLAQWLLHIRNTIMLAKTIIVLMSFWQMISLSLNFKYLMNTHIYYNVLFHKSFIYWYKNNRKLCQNNQVNSHFENFLWTYIQYKSICLISLTKGQNFIFQNNLGIWKELRRN